MDGGGISGDADVNGCEASFVCDGIALIDKLLDSAGFYVGNIWLSWDKLS